MIPAGMLGKFICEYQGQIIEVAPGCLNHEALINIWKERESMIGWIVKFRSFAHGVKDKPRFPRFVGFRDRMDM
jgi:DNA ligase-1